MRTLPENYNIIQAVEPKTTNAAITGKYTNIKNALVAFVVVHLTQAAGHATTISLYQAKDTSGTDAKALASNVPIWVNEDVAASNDLTRSADGVTYSVTNNIKNKVVVFQIEPEKLDINNGFVAINARIGASSQATNFCSVEYLLENKYGQATPPTA